MASQHEYDVALSFAGEDRETAEELANALRGSAVRVFYDLFSQADLWGKDLFQHLQVLYRDKARFCIPVISESYIKKKWTKHELKQMQARAFTDETEYILPLRLDDTLVPGLNETVGYLDLRTTRVDQVVTILLEKLGRPTDQFGARADRAAWDGDFIEYNGHRVASYWPKQIERAQHAPAYLTARPLERIRYGKEKRYGPRHKGSGRFPCGDCGVLLGQLHVPGCDIEECPACRGQAISCGCDHQPMTVAERERWVEREPD